MTNYLTRAALGAALLFVGQTSSIAKASPLTLERVVIVMRHGIRPPTSATPAPPGYTSETWPKWSVDFGLLTERGAAGVRLLGAADAKEFAARGLFGKACPAPGSVVLKASAKPRAYVTAANWYAGFAASCPALAVDHPVGKQPDPIFHGLDDEPVDFDGARALDEAKALLPRGGLDEETERHRPVLALIANALGCAAPACPLVAGKSLLVGAPHDRPSIEGPLDEGSSISQTFLLEYLEGMPMRDVAWGRATRGEIEQMLALHPLKFRYANRPGYVARTAAAPLVAEIRKGLADRGAKLTLLAGHDTNLADLGGYYRLHWQVPSYPRDDVPPGSALGFELLRDARGVRFVRAFYRAQTMDQLRGLTPLTGPAHPFRTYLPIPGCGNSLAPKACTFTRFSTL